MHLGEAITPRAEAIALAAAELRRVVARNAHYYARVPESLPNPNRPLPDQITADDTLIYIPFERQDPAQKPIVVRVNGITKVVSIERVF